MGFYLLLKSPSVFFNCAEYAEVYIDCDSPVRQSPSNRPPAMVPPDAHLPNVRNTTLKETNEATGGLNDNGTFACN